MKKILIGIAIIIIIFTASWKIFINKSNNSNNGLTKVRLAEVTHSSFYTPLYVASELGYFKEYGIDLELILTPGADKVSSAVLSGDVEIGFAGAESAIYIYEENQNDYLQIFAGLTKRDGQFIVSKEPIEDFTLESLYGKEILVGRSTGMPALNFLSALKSNGIDTDKININYSVEFSALSGTFIGGNGDFVNLFEPNATKLQNEGYGYIVASIGSLTKEVPYTTFYAKKSFIENNEKLLTNFTQALNKGIKYTFENDSTTVAKAIINAFPDTSIDDLALMIENYKVYDCWLSNPYISEGLFTNMEDFLIDFDLLNEHIPYQNLVKNFYNA